MEPVGQHTKPWSLTAGPFVGVRDAHELAAQDVNRALSMQNMYAPVPEIGADVWRRAGVIQRTIPGTIDGVANWTGPSLGTVGVSVGSTKKNVMLVKRSTNSGLAGAGVDWFSVGGSSTNVYGFVSYTAPTTYAATLSGAAGGGTGRTINDPATTANRFFYDALGDYIIFTQSGGKVWVLDPATMIVLNPTDLTDDVYGRPTVYYGKFFATLEADFTTIVWSEENDPDIGYQATGYDNFWTLRQTSKTPIMALCGTNEALLVFRQDSCSSITGAVNSDFRSFGTLEGISGSIGTLAPDSVFVANNAVWFLDQFCRPHKIEPGRGLVPLWANCRQTIKTADLTATVQFGNWGRHIPDTDMVIFRVMLQSGAPVHLIYSARTEEFLGTWTGWDAVSPYGNIGYDSTGRSMLTITLDGTTYPLNNFVTQKADTAQDQRDELAGGTAHPACIVETPKMFGDPDTLFNGTSLTVTGQRYESVQPVVNYTIKGSSDGFQSYPSAAQMDNDGQTEDGAPTRYVVGTDLRHSRWAQVKLTNDTADSANARFSVGQVRVGGTTQRVDPASP